MALLGQGLDSITDAATLSDEDLVIRFLNEKRDSFFITLVDRYIPLLRRMLYTLFAGAREHMEDAEQEILASLYVAIPRFRFKCKFSTYFYRFSRNTAISSLRKIVSERRRSEMLQRSEPEPPESNEEEIYRKQIMDDVMAILDTLPAHEREIIYMREFEQLSLDAIAKTLSCPVGTIKSRLYRVKAKIREKLEKKGYDGKR